MILFTSNYGAMIALAGALACGGSTATELCRADFLAVHAATASSVESNHFVADWAVDGDTDSRWASDGPNHGSPRQWLKLDLGDFRSIDSINLQWERAYSRNYQIQVSDNGNLWETVSTIPNGKEGEVEVSMLNVIARYVRILSLEGDSNYGISLFEVKIFGDSDVDCCHRTGIHPDVAVASSREVSVFGPENAIDGDLSTRWSSQFNDVEWFAVDLGAQTLVGSVWLFWERAFGLSYQLQTGDSLLEEGTWTTISTITESDGDVDILDGLNVRTRYLRLLTSDRATIWGHSLWEFEVYGTQNPVCCADSGPF
jgi:hypothetical protein